MVLVVTSCDIRKEYLYIILIIYVDSMFRESNVTVIYYIWSAQNVKEVEYSTFNWVWQRCWTLSNLSQLEIQYLVYHFISKYSQLQFFVASWKYVTFGTFLSQSTYGTINSEVSFGSDNIFYIHIIHRLTCSNWEWIPPSRILLLFSFYTLLFLFWKSVMQNWITIISFALFHEQSQSCENGINRADRGMKKYFQNYIQISSREKTKKLT